MSCSRCRLRNCPGPHDCLVDCLECDDSKEAICPDDCDNGWRLDETTDEFSIRCTRCRGKGRIRCPKC